MNHGKYVGKCGPKSSYADGGVIGTVKSVLGMKSDAQKTADARIKRDAAKGKDNRNIFDRAKTLADRSAPEADVEGNAPQPKQE